jgi:hypothetical protein
MRQRERDDPRLDIDKKIENEKTPCGAVFFALQITVFSVFFIVFCANSVEAAFVSKASAGNLYAVRQKHVVIDWPRSVKNIKQSFGRVMFFGFEAAGRQFAEIPNQAVGAFQYVGDSMAGIMNGTKKGLDIFSDNILHIGEIAGNVAPVMMNAGRQTMASLGMNAEKIGSSFVISGLKAKTSTGDLGENAIFVSATAENIAKKENNWGAFGFVKSMLDFFFNIGRSVATFVSESGKSLGEIFVNAPRTVLENSFRQMSSTGTGANSGLSGIIDERKVVVGTEPVTSVAPNVEGSITTSKDGQAQDRPPSMIVQPAPAIIVQRVVTAPKAVSSVPTTGNGVIVTDNAMRGTYIFAGPVFFNNNMNGGNVFLLDTASGKMSLVGIFDVAGDILTQNLTVKNNADFTGATVDFTGATIKGLNISSGSQVNNIYNSYTTVSQPTISSFGLAGQFQALNVLQDSTMQGLLTVSGSATFNNGVTIGDAAADILTIKASSIDTPNGIVFSGGAVNVSSTVTSTFNAGIAAAVLNITGTSVSSTFANGIQISSGCYLMPDGTCAGSGSSGANAALSNLASVAINTSLLSDTNNTDDLGSYVLSWKNIYASGTIFGSLATSTWYGSFTTSTFDGVAIGASTRGTGAFTSLSSTGVFAPTGGIATSTLDGVVIGGSTATAGNFTTFNANGNITLGDGLADLITIYGQTSSTLLSVYDSLYIGRSATTTLTVGNRGAATSTFYSDVWLPNRDMLIGGINSTGNLWVGDGSATTTVRGGTIGSATSTFMGDVSIQNLYSGLSVFGEDMGLVDAMDMPVSASATTGTEEGYGFLVDGLPVARVLATADALGSVWDWRLELTDNFGTATTTLRGGSGTTSTFAGNVAVIGNFKANCTVGDGCVDLAEAYSSTEAVGAGDVVVSAALDSVLGSALVKKSTSGYAGDVIGVVSTNPGMVLGVDGSVQIGYGAAGDSYKPNVALAGRVPVKVTNENGEIKRGDLLVTSVQLAGYGMAAGSDFPERMVSVFAMALEDWNPTAAVNSSAAGVITNKVMALIKNSTIYNKTLTVSQVGSDIVTTYDFANQSLYNIKSLISASGAWSLDENGVFKAKTINAKTISLDDLIISGDKNIDEAGVTTDATVGDDFIPSGASTKIITNNRVKKNSKIFVTFRDNTGGSWWISAQDDGLFEIAVPTAMSYDIHFNYWIVGVTETASMMAPAESVPAVTDSASPTDDSTTTTPTTGETQ